jgi:hypothetical protein
MKRIIILVAGLAVLIGVGAILPALAQVREVGAIPGAFVASYTLGVVLVSAVGATTVTYALTRRKTARRI